MTTNVYTPGICRICGCTELNPCILQEILFDPDGDPTALTTCGWMDAGRTLCTNPLCIAVIPVGELVKICFPELEKKAAAG